MQLTCARASDKRLLGRGGRSNGSGQPEDIMEKSTNLDSVFSKAVAQLMLQQLQLPLQLPLRSTRTRVKKQAEDSILVKSTTPPPVAPPTRGPKLDIYFGLRQGGLRANPPPQPNNIDNQESINSGFHAKRMPLQQDCIEVTLLLTSLVSSILEPCVGLTTLNSPFHVRIVPSQDLQTRYVT